MFVTRTVIAVLSAVLLPGCDSSNARPDTGIVDEPTFLTARELPKGFPVNDVPVLTGKVLRTQTGYKAGAPRGKDAWSVELAIDSRVEECYRSAVDALLDRGLRETQSFNQGASKQSFLAGLHRHRHCDGPRGRERVHPYLRRRTGRATSCRIRVRHCAAAEADQQGFRPGTDLRVDCPSCRGDREWIVW